MARPSGRLTIDWLREKIQLDSGETGAVFWAGCWFFSILCSYYILRPMRDEMGSSGGVEKLPWLFAGTLAAMLLTHPVFSFIAGRYTRRSVVKALHRFFALNLVFFFFVLSSGSREAGAGWITPVFWIWNSVFNLVVVSLFWAFVVDIFTAGAGRRIFGLIALGGTLGGVFGSLLTAVASRWIRPSYLLVLAALLLEVAVYCMTRLSGCARSERSVLGSEDGPGPAPDSASGRPLGGGIWAGFEDLLRSRYLSAIALFMLLFTVTATFLYFQQAELFAHHYPDRSQRTSMFATVDLIVNCLTILSQVFLTGFMMRSLGLSLTLSILPLTSVVGFLAMGAHPSILVLICFQVLRRAGDYALTRPAREVLFTVVPREDKYKAKNLIDTFIYRTGDQVGAWSYGWMAGVGMGAAAISWVAVPLAICWLALSVWLGKQAGMRRGYGEAGEVAGKGDPN